MLPLLLAILFGLMPQSGVVTHMAMLEPVQRTLDLIYNNVHDLQGERQAAPAWYQGVQGDEQAEARARAYIATPFVPAQIDLKPLEQAVI